MEKSLIEARGCGVDAECRSILSDVTLSVPEGEWLAITGPNGAGKSTLLRLLARLARPSAGELTFAGRPAAELSQREIARFLGYVPQLASLSIPYNVREFLLLGRYCLSDWTRPGGNTRADEAAVDRVMERIGIGALADRMVSSLSGGERQRVLLGGSIVQDPKVLLLDEPSAYLDPRHQVEIGALLAGLHAGGMTIVAITHDLNSRILTGARNVLALKEGRPFFWGSPRDFLDSARLEALYGVHFDRCAGRGVELVFPRTEGGPA